MIRASCPDAPGLFDELETGEVERYRDGSARIALQTQPPFDKYVFIEKDPAKCEVLEDLKASFPESARKIDIRNGDANTCIASMCSPRRDWTRHRAVMFLDPFGMQVGWKTIELIAATRAIDLWYLFPIGSVNRLLERKQCQHGGFADCLDRTLGARDWRDVFYKRSVEQALFGSGFDSLEKDASFEEIGRYIVTRLKTVFAGVVEVPYVLRNSKSAPLFMLCFVVGNPNPKALGPALTIARDILMKD